MPPTITTAQALTLLEFLTDYIDEPQKATPTPNIGGQPTRKFNQAEIMGIPLGGGNLDYVKSNSGANFQVNEKVAPQFQAFIDELQSNYNIDPNSWCIFSKSIR